MDKIVFSPKKRTKHSTSLVLAIIIEAIFPGCHKNNDVSYGMRATINGAAFTGRSIISKKTSSVLSITGGNFTGANTSTAHPNIILYIDNYAGNGTYSLIASSTNQSGSIIDSGGMVYGAVSAYGTVTISASSPDVVGAFFFTSLDSTKVTNGWFAAKAP